MGHQATASLPLRASADPSSGVENTLSESDHLTDTPRITKSLATEAKTIANAAPSWEVCGIFWWPDLNPWGSQPAFLQVTNSHMYPEKNFMIDWSDVEDAFGDRFGDRDHVNGEIALFHSHPFGDGQPSRGDEAAIEDLAKRLDGHPMLRPTFRHLIFALWDQSWWWYDLVSFGRIGWEFPE